MKKSKMITAVSVMFILLIAGGVFVKKVYPQIRYETLTAILPGADRYHADRFFMTGNNGTRRSSTSTTVIMGDNTALIGPIPWKCRILSIWATMDSIGTTTVYSPDSTRLVLFSGIKQTSSINDASRIIDTTRWILPADSIMKTLVVKTTRDTLSVGWSVFSKLLDAKGDYKTSSAGSAPDTARVSVMFELQILK